MLINYQNQNILTVRYSMMERIWVGLMILAFSITLPSCGTNHALVESSQDPCWTVDESTIWIGGKRENVYVLIVRDDSLLGKVTGKGGGIRSYYVTEPPPWTRGQANQLIDHAESWQYPASAPFPKVGLDEISRAMGAWSRFRRYLISIDPLVIAITNEGPQNGWGCEFRVHLVDTKKDLQTASILILDGENPANAILFPGSEDYETEAIRSRTRTIKTSGMTLTDILNTPSLWMDQE